MSHKLSSEDSFSLSVAALARVEGEGALDVTVEDGKVVHTRLSIYEPPRFFEAFLRGRGHREPADITARICGICPVAYQMSAVHAIEAACGVRVTGPIRDLRRLIYCGEWIESHTLHVAMLHAPDFLGYDGAVAMAADHPELVELALRLKKAGNAVVELVGGRPIHPVNVQLGGFYRAPTRAELRTLVAPLEQARHDAHTLLSTVSTFDFPDAEEDYDFVALRTSTEDGHPAEYPFNEGRIVSSRGRSFPVDDFERHVVETHEPHSTALHGHWRDGGTYLVGPLARYALNSDRLPPSVRAAAAEAGLGPVCRNMFTSIVVRVVEVIYACEEALRIIAGYEPPDHPHVEVEPRAGEGHGCTEAPRGILYHRYRLAADGTITDARIVPPTAQNQPVIEADLRRLVQRHLDLPHEQLRARCEQAIRNYDPCISCATHFLDLRIARR
jgi:coenzyme F420-reducing hydrogenase alpha subunit